MEKRLQSSIAAYLASKKKDVADPDALEVAISCLTEAFGISAADQEAAASPSLLSIFEKGLASSDAASSFSSSSSSASPTSGGDVESSPLWKRYIESLGKAGFFGTAVEGSPAYEEKLAKAKEKFVKQQQNMAAASAPAVTYDEAAAEKAKAEGNTHVGAGRHREAVECYTRAIELAGPQGKSLHIYYCNRAAAKTSLGDNKGAEADARASIAANASFAKAHSRLGTALLSQGKVSDAVDALEKCLELDPSNDAARENLRSARDRLGKAGSAAASAMSTSGAGSGASAGGAGGMPGGLGGADGGGLASLLNNPMLAGLMSNPQVMQAAQKMMQDPAAMQQMLGALGGAGGGGAGGGLGGLASMLGSMGGGAGGRKGGPMDGGDDEDEN